MRLGIRVVALRHALRRLGALTLWLLCVEFAAATAWNLAQLLLWMVRSQHA